jgi:hypothetical protein
MTFNWDAVSAVSEVIAAAAVVIYGRNNLAHSFVEKVESIAAAESRVVVDELSGVLSTDR